MKVVVKIPKRIECAARSLALDHVHRHIPLQPGGMEMKKALLAISFALLASAAQAQTLGTYSDNPYAPNRASGIVGGGDYGNSSNSPGLYTNQGQFRGNLNSNQYDPDSVANPYGHYGSQYSPDSINNPYGAGSPYRQDSPTNRYGTGLTVCGINGCD